MKKHRLFTAFASLAMLFLGGLPTFAQGNTTAVPFTETFDDDSHFTQGGNLPDGWAATKTEGDKGYVRTQWYDYGVQPNSGEYYLASENMGIANRDEYLFTPMMQLTGGEERRRGIHHFILHSRYSLRPGQVSFTRNNSRQRADSRGTDRRY